MNMTEKIVFFSCTILFSLLMAITPVSATAIVSIADFSSNPGETITMPISIENVTDYGTGTISITYDASIVHVIDVTSSPDSTVLDWNPDNTTGIVIISAWNTGGVNGNIIFANVSFHAVGNAGETALNLSVITLKEYSYPYPDIPNMRKNGSFLIRAPTPFFISGFVNYTNGDPALNLSVTVTNLNTSENLVVDTKEGFNYYRALTTSYNVTANDVLHFNATSDGKSAEYNHAVTVEELKSGGLQQNLSISSGICGDVNGDSEINMDDVMTLWYDYANYPYPGAYTVSNEWAADVTGDGIINMDDVMTLWYDYANYPYPGAYEVNCR